MPPAPPVLCCWRYLPPGQQRKQLPRPQRSAFTSPFSVMAKDRHRVPFNATLYPSLGSQPSLASLLKTLRARRPTCPAPDLYKSRHRNRAPAGTQVLPPRRPGKVPANSRRRTRCPSHSQQAPASQYQHRSPVPSALSHRCFLILPRWAFPSVWDGLPPSPQPWLCSLPSVPLTSMSM